MIIGETDFSASPCFFVRKPNCRCACQIRFATENLPCVRLPVYLSHPLFDGTATENLPCVRLPVCLSHPLFDGIATENLSCVRLPVCLSHLLFDGIATEK
jgi:hypothetical protein